MSLLTGSSCSSFQDPQGPRFKFWAFMLQNRFGGQRLPAVQRQGFISLCVFARPCLHVKQWHGRRRRCTLRNSVCSGHVTVSVCLNYLAQRPDRGVNQVRSSLLQCFSSLQPHISTSTRCALMLQSSSDSLSVSINRKLVTKGSPHVTDVLSIMGRLRKEKHQSN